MRFHTLLAVSSLSLAMMLACGGGDGPAGPAGAQGAPGAQGTPGQPGAAVEGGVVTDAGASDATSDAAIDAGPGFAGFVEIKRAAAPARDLLVKLDTFEVGATLAVGGGGPGPGLNRPDVSELSLELDAGGLAATLYQDLLAGLSYDTVRILAPGATPGAEIIAASTTRVTAFVDNGGRQRVSIAFEDITLSSGATKSTYNVVTDNAGACPTGCVCTPGSDLDTFVQSSDPQYVPLAPLVRIDTLEHGGLVALGGGGGGGGGGARPNISSVRAHSKLTPQSICAFQSLVDTVVHGKITFHTAAAGSTPQAPFYDTSVEGKCSTVFDRVTIKGSRAGIDAQLSAFLGAFVYTSREKLADGGVSETTATWSTILNMASEACQ